MKLICLNSFFWMLVLPQITLQNLTLSLENDLPGKLLGTYAAHQIPRNGTNPLLVTVTILVTNVVNVDVMRYTVTTILLLNQSWYNTQMAWDEAEFHVPTFTVPWDSVWTPTHTIVEAFTTSWKTNSPSVLLHSDGKAEFQLALNIDSNCNFNLFYYPRDTSLCTLSFVSLSNTVNEIEFKVSVENEILSARREYVVTDLSIFNQRIIPHPFFMVMVKLENRGFRVFFSIIVPSFALVVADLCGFLIPIQDRLSYMITLLLAYLVFHSSLVGSLPGASSCFPLLRCCHADGFKTILWFPLSFALVGSFLFLCMLHKSPSCLLRDHFALFRHSVSMCCVVAFMLTDSFVPSGVALCYKVFFNHGNYSLRSADDNTPAGGQKGYYYIGLLALLFISTIETILVTKLVAVNSHRSQNCGSQKQKPMAIAVVNKNESDCPASTKDPVKTDCGSTKDTPHLIRTSATLDKIFFFIYIGLVIAFHFLFFLLWLFWKCQSVKSPREHLLKEIQWE